MGNLSSHEYEKYTNHKDLGYKSDFKSDGPVRHELGPWEEIGITAQDRSKMKAKLQKMELDDTAWQKLQADAVAQHGHPLATLTTDLHIPFDDPREVRSIEVVEEQSGKVVHTYQRESRPLALWDAFEDSDSMAAYYTGRRFSFDWFRQLATPERAQKVAEELDEMELEDGEDDDSIFELLKLASYARESKSSYDLNSVPLMVLSLEITALPAGEPYARPALRLAAHVWIKDHTSFLKGRFEFSEKWLDILGGLDCFDSNNNLLEECHESRENHSMWRGRSSKVTEPPVATVLAIFEKGPMEGAAQPKGLTVEMKDYQLQSLHWMLDKEQNGLLKSISVGVKTLNGQDVRYIPGIDQPLIVQNADDCYGGFLCEEMGLGKTIISLGLILSNPAPADLKVGTLDANGKVISGGTLVVCALSLIGQWVAEAKRKTPDLKVYTYHGGARKKDPKFLANFDVVVTTYQTLTADSSKRAETAAIKKKVPFAPPALQIRWHRVLLDESHMIKTSESQQAKVCRQLIAKYRWCVTGTPINTTIKDMLSQIKFLNLPLLYTGSAFDSLLKHHPTSLAHLLARMVTRHSAKQEFNGKPILELPPKTQHDIIVTMDDQERQAYDKTAAEIRARYEAIRALGHHGIRRFTIKLMSLMLPLRQACSGGPAMPLPAKTESDLLLDQMSSKTVEERQKMLSKLPQLSVVAEGECPICLDVMEDPVMTKCQHQFCFQCVSSYIAASIYNDTASCPLCRKDIKLRQLTRIGKNDDTGETDAKRSKVAAEVDAAAQAAAQAVEMVVYESKLRALIEKLEEIRAEDPSAKVLVFSQFKTSLSYLQAALPAAGFQFGTLTGDMNRAARTKALESFAEDPNTTVFLMSTRAGSVGINLIQANHVFLFEPTLNPATEQQAIGRVWRMGQTRPVSVYQMLCENSIDTRILSVRTSRATTAVGAITTDTGAFTQAQYDTLFRA